MNKVKTNAKVIEIDWLSDTIVRIYKSDENAQKDTVLHEIMGELESLSAKINVATQQKKAISNLEIASKERDKAIKAVGTVLSGYAVMHAEEKRTAAESLKKILDEYIKKGFFKYSYREKSAIIEDLIAALSTEEATLNIEMLEGVDAIFSEMKRMQENFTSSNDTYVKELTLKEKSATSYKRPILSLINKKLVPYLNAISLENHPHLKNIVDSVETEISRLNTLLLSRRTSSKKEQAS